MVMKNIFQPNPSRGQRPPVVDALPAIAGALEGEDYILSIDGHKYTANKRTNPARWERGLTASDDDTIWQEITTYADNGDAATLTSANEYTDTKVTSIFRFRGLYDASGGLFPATGGSGTGGAIVIGDSWRISVEGDMGGEHWSVGEYVQAIVDAPGQTASNWDDLDESKSRYFRVLYVDKLGNDSNGGNALNPFLTVGAALTKALTMTPATATPVDIIVGPGVWAEAITIAQRGINLYGFGQGNTQFQYAGTCLTLQDNGVDNPPYDFKSVGISYGSTDSLEYGVKILGIAGSNIGSSEIQFRDCRIGGTKSRYATLCNYIDDQNTYVIGSQLFEQVAGIWLEDSESAGAITETYDTGGAKPSDTGHYGIFFVRHIPRGTVTASLIGEDKRPINYKLDSFAPSSGIPAETDTHQEAIEKITGYLRNSEYWVSAGGSDTAGTGSRNNPFATVQHVINTYGVSSSHKWIYVDGSTTEDLAFANVQNITIAGRGVMDSQKETIFGNHTVSGTSTRIRFKDIILEDGGSDTYIITYNGTAGRHYTQNLSFICGAAGKAILFTGANDRWHEFYDCFIDGDVDCSSTDASMSVKITRQLAQNFKLNMNTAVEVKLFGCQRIDQIVHAAGKLYIHDLDEFWRTSDNVGIISTVMSSASGYLELKNVKMQNTASTMMIINKTGDCDYALINVARNVANDVLVGTQILLETAKDVDANHTPVKYTATNDSVSSHLSGIDTALGLRDKTNPVDLTAASWTDNTTYYDMTIAAATHGMAQITGVALFVKISGTGKWQPLAGSYWEVDATTGALYLQNATYPWAADPAGTSVNYVGKLFIKGIA